MATKEKKNGKAKDTKPATLSGAGLGYRYKSLAREHVEGGHGKVTALLMLSLFSEEENYATLSDGSKRPWTAEEHAEAWAELKEHPEAEAWIDAKSDEEHFAENPPDAPEDMSAESFAGATDEDEPSFHGMDDEEDDEGDEGDEDESAKGPTRYLKKFLTKSEIDALREGREAQDEAIEKLELELAAAKKQAQSLQKRIDTMIEDGLAASKRIRVGYEMDYVRCEERREVDTREDSPTKGKTIMVTYRLDTNEAIEWRSLRADERQGKLWDDAPRADVVVINVPAGSNGPSLTEAPVA